MMKIFASLFVLFFSVLNCSAQWKGTYNVDSYSEEKTPMLTYGNSKELWKVIYTDNALGFVFLHISSDNFDLWWNSQMENNGWISYESDIDLNFIGNEPKEFNLHGEIENYDKGELYFRVWVDDSDGEILKLLKSNNKLNIRFYNIVEEQTMVYNIPLSGVSAQCKKVGL